MLVGWREPGWPHEMRLGSSNVTVRATTAEIADRGRATWGRPRRRRQLATPNAPCAIVPLNPNELSRHHDTHSAPRGSAATGIRTASTTRSTTGAR